MHYRPLLSYLFFPVFLIASCHSKNAAQSPGKWTSLFNGKDMNGWIVKIHHHEVGENFGNTFRVEDGIIKVRYDQYGDFNEQFGHLYYKTPFSYFHLKLQYRFVGQWVKTAPSYTVRRHDLPILHDICSG